MIGSLVKWILVSVVDPALNGQVNTGPVDASAVFAAALIFGLELGQI